MKSEGEIALEKSKKKEGKSVIMQNATNCGN